MLRKTVKAGFFCDFYSFSSCGKDWGVGGMVFGEGTTASCGHPSKGGELTLAGFGMGVYACWAEGGMLFCVLTLWLIIAGMDYKSTIESDSADL